MQNHTGRQEYSHCVSVFRRDRQDMTRPDQFRIQADTLDDIINAATAGEIEFLDHAGTRLLKRNLLVFCSEDSTKFYKEVISKLKDKNGDQAYDCYLPGDKMPGHRIFTNILPSCMKSRVLQIPKLFCIGNGFNKVSRALNISYDQVRTYGTPVVTRSGLTITLEIDDAAFQHLSTKNWMSWIGLFGVRWQAPPVAGLTGYVPPDQDPREVRKALFDSKIALTQNNFPPLTEGNSTGAQANSSSVSAPNTSPGSITVTPTVDNIGNTETTQNIEHDSTEMINDTQEIIEDLEPVISDEDEENRLLGENNQQDKDADKGPQAMVQ